MSNPNKKPEPLFIPVARVVCPVCGHTTYSHEGIHPQCAMLAADKVHITRINAQKLIQPEVSTDSTLRRHEKRCPTCQGVQPIRRYKCDCGHVFQIAKGSSPY